METIFDEYFSFPEEDETAFNELHKLLQGVEQIEEDFNIEFSCGDGKYMSDFWKWSDSGEGLGCTVTDEELEKYDGKVCLKTVPRFADTKELFKPNKTYRFTVKVTGPVDDVEATFLINGKERSRRSTLFS